MQSQIDRVWREERAGIVASLARRFSDLALAEDAVQEAFVAATIRWPVDGFPERPGAWLTTTAYRKAISMVRKQRPTIDLCEDLESGEPVPVSGNDLDRDLFGLLLACCHPSLTRDARIALTLRHVCGLTDSEIAAHLLVTESALTKRLVRARRKIKDAAISFETPGTGVLRDRIDDVHTVIYVVFTEGHLSASQRRTVRGDLCDEAIWLARQVLRLQPGNADSAALLALLIIQNSRRNARETDDGDLVRFDEQDRTRWDHDAIEEARVLIGSIESRVLGRLQVEAAIALLHVVGDKPNWPRIADLYGVLSRIAPSPIVEINRAIAVGRADGAHAGLANIAPLMERDDLAANPSAHAAYAQLLEECGRHTEASAAWARGATKTRNAAQQRAMTKRAQRLGPSRPPDREA